MRTCVVIASTNRAATLHRTLSELANQTREPIGVIVSCVKDADVAAAALPFPITIIRGQPGLTQQRNAALDVLPPDTDIVAFLDDDFIAHATWIDEVERCFEKNPDVVAITGNVVADGIKGPGLSVTEAIEILRAADPRRSAWIQKPYSPYGCNMAFRLAAVGNARFDERLPLYGWQEDRDFGAQMAQRGDLVKLGSALGVHLGVKGGRVSGRRLGYSQVANPAYLYRKGTMTLDAAFTHVSKNLAANFARALWPEPDIDRAGRLRGNLEAIWDGINGRDDPERVKSL